MTQQLPPVIRTADVQLSAERAFAVFTEEMGAWWPLRTHGIFGQQSGGVRFVDGKLVEVSVDGTEAVWAEVLTWEPPKKFAMAWHPGSADGPTSRVEVTFEAIGDGVDGHGTRVEIRHDGWEAFGDEGLARRRGYTGPSAWGSVLDHFADGTEPYRGNEPMLELAAAYEEFFAEAERGGFGPPPEGEWNAEQVVAHVALNDLAMTAVAQGLVHRAEPSFGNHTCQELSNLTRVIDNHQDMAGLIAFARTCATQAMAAVARLDIDQQAELVACKLEHDGHVVLDEPRPWAPLAVTVQANMHLPAHTGQLRDLRTASR
ncbi:MAG: SRPBCC domain-containing protein [Acidimicrobiales bacterium]